MEYDSEIQCQLGEFGGTVLSVTVLSCSSLTADLPSSTRSMSMSRSMRDDSDETSAVECMFFVLEGV
jgi:hypothetical protein